MSSLKAGTSLFLPWHLQLWGTRKHEYLLNELLNGSGWMLCEKRSDPKVGKMRFNPDGTGASLGGGKGQCWDLSLQSWEQRTEASHQLLVKT